MSAIAGIFRFDDMPADRSDLERMTNALQAHGPDRSGSYAEGPIGLGHVLMRMTAEESFDANGQTFGNGLFFSTGYNDVSTYVNYVGAADSMKVSQISTLHIETWDGRFIGTLNGQPVKIPEPKAPILNAGGMPRLAIYSLYPATDTTVYVSELKVRKLKEAPPGLGALSNQ